MILTLVLSYLFATWMFRKIESMNRRLAEEKARRAVYEERERLARELHDHIAQMVFFLNVQLGKGRLEEARAAVSEINDHVRQAIFNLRTPPAGGASLTDRLRTWLREWSSLSGIETRSRLSVENGFFTAGEEILLFGLIQEAFTNIRKHSEADSAELELRTFRRNWTLRIADDGVGIGSDLSSSARQYGISMMKKRAEELGTRLEIRRLDPHGTELLLKGKKER